MADIIESVAKLLPFSKWGMNKEIAEPLSIIILSTIAFVAGLAIKNVLKRVKAKRTALNALMSQFDWVFIKKARKHYIPTRYQNVSPSKEEEPGFTHLYVSTSQLIPFFIKTAFNHRSASERFYLVLGDSGMGKTTFLINLYLRYHQILTPHSDLKMRIYRMLDNKTLEYIKAIPHDQAQETILLLDSLDEDSLLYPSDTSVSEEKAFRDRVDIIISATNSFPIVVMTCRTQYFPGQESNPYELKIRRANENGFYLLNKIYISPFTMQEVRRYLRNRYYIHGHPFCLKSVSTDKTC